MMFFPLKPLRKTSLLPLNQEKYLIKLQVFDFPHKSGYQKKPLIFVEVVKVERNNDNSSPIR